MKEPSGSPGEGKMKASRKNSCRELLYPSVYPRAHTTSWCWGYGRLCVGSLNVVSRTGWAEVSLTHRGREQARAPLLSNRHIQLLLFPPTMDDWTRTRTDKEYGTCSRHLGSAEKHNLV